MSRWSSIVATAFATAAACSSFDATDSQKDADAGSDGGVSITDAAGFDATGDAGDGGPPRLSAVWARELVMTDGGSVGASVAAASGGDGVHVLFSGSGGLGGIVATSDAVLARVHGDGRLGAVSAHGGAGDQNARAVMADGSGRVFVSWLDYASASDWRSYVRRVDVDAASPAVLVDPGGSSEKDHLIALAPLAGGNYFYTGISGKRLLLGAGPNNTLQGDGNNEAIGLAAAGLGDGVIFAGRTASPFSVGEGCEVVPASPANATGFVIKLTNTLACGWRTALTATGATEASAIGARDAIVAVAGSFSGTLASTGLTATNGIWLARLDAQNGNVLWVRSFTSQGATFPRAAVIDAAGRIVVAGGITTSVEIDGRTLAANGSPCGFVAVFDSAGGQLLDAVRFGEVGNVTAFSVDVGPPGEIYVGGTTYEGAALGLPGASPASAAARSFVARFAF